MSTYGALRNRELHARNDDDDRGEFADESNSETVLKIVINECQVARFYGPRCIVYMYMKGIFEYVACNYQQQSKLISTANVTRGQSNLTKSASRGAHSLVRGHPRGSKFVPLNSWGMGSY